MVFEDKQFPDHSEESQQPDHYSSFPSGPLHHGPPLPPIEDPDPRPPHERMADLEDRIDYLEKVVEDLIRHVGYKPPDSLLRK